MAQTAQEIRALIKLEPASIAEAAVHLVERRKEAEIFSLGLRFCKYTKFELALVFFDKVIEMNPQNAQAYVNIGNIYHEFGNIEVAANFWRYALTVDATAEKAYLNLGNYYYQKGDVDQAISYWLILQSISPTENNSLFNLGVSYQEKGELLLSYFYFEKYLDKAITQKGFMHYEKVNQMLFRIKVDAKHNFRIGLKCQRHKDLPRALKAYMNVAKGYPLHIKANINAGSICYLNEKFEDAIKFWRTVLILEPQNKKNIINLAIAHDRAGQNSYAFCLYSRYLGTQEDLKTFEMVKLQSRIKELEQALDDKNNHYNVHSSKAEEFFRKKDYLNALAEFENCLILKPDNEELQKRTESIRSALFPETNLARAYIHSGKRALNNLEIAAAVEHFRAAYNLNPNEDRLIEIKENMAKCARIINRSREAAGLQ